MNITAISNTIDFEGIEQDWDNIFKSINSGNIFISWEWCYLWWQYFGSDNELLVLKVTDGEDVVGIAPLMVMRGGLNKNDVCFIGGILADYSDFLILRNNREVIKAIINYLVREKLRNKIIFDRIPESSQNLIHIKEVISEFNYPYSFRISGICPSVKIEGDWDSYYKRISKGIRQDIRTSHNKFKLLGDLSFEITDEKSYGSSLSALFEFHERRQAVKIGRSMFESKVYRDFFHDLSMKFLNLQWADISVLKINGRIISAAFAFRRNGTYYYWIPVFDPDFTTYSIGKVHLYYLLKKCFDDGYSKFDLMRGDEDYKFKWADSSMSNHEITIYRSKALYKLDLIKDIARSRIKDLYNRNSLFRNMLIRFSKIRLRKS